MDERMKQATESGDINALHQLVFLCSINNVTMRNETALHIALKNDQLEAVKFLVGWLGRNFFKKALSSVKSILDQKDDEGNTVLHIAVSKNQTQIVSHLLAWGFQFLDVKIENSEGKTAWDILQGQTQVNSREIELMLHSAGALSGVPPPSNTQSGDNNIDEFYNLIGEDVQLLKHIDELPFVNTPLHIAASYGNIQFALEMMSLKPSFARKQNQNGFSPIHLALQNGHIELVRRLLHIDADLVRVKGREKLTPLHYLAENGEHLNLLDEFLSRCPDSIIDVTVRNETVLHIALKHNKLETFRFFVGWLANNSSENAEFNRTTVLNWKDNKGNSVLHILVSRDETQVVRHFLSWGNRFLGKRFVDVNSKNLEDKTAWDMLQEGNREIRDRLCLAGAKPGSSLSRFNGDPNPEYQRLFTVSWVDAILNNNLTVPLVDTVLSYNLTGSSVAVNSEIRKLSVEWRSMLVVVAALLVTLCFQAVLTPPGGVWQDNGKCIPTEPGSSYHRLSPSNIFKKIPPSNKSVGSSNYPKIIYLSQSNTTLACEHKAGTAIALEYRFFALFLVCNTMLFALSNSLIVVLTSKLNMKALFIPFNIILCLSYFYSAWIITDAPSLMIPLASVASFYFLSAIPLAWEM